MWSYQRRHCILHFSSEPLIHPSPLEKVKKRQYYNLTPTVVKEFVNFFDKEATSLHIAVVNLKFKNKVVWDFQ